MLVEWQSTYVQHSRMFWRGLLRQICRTYHEGLTRSGLAIQQYKSRTIFSFLTNSNKASMLATVTLHSYVEMPHLWVFWISFLKMVYYKITVVLDLSWTLRLCVEDLMGCRR